jgi:xylulokinase
VGVSFDHAMSPLSETMTPFVGIDIGTSGTKVLAVDQNGRVVGGGEHSHQTSHPQPGFSEQDPEQWISSARAALGQLGTVRPAGIAVTGQMHGLVLLDSHDRLLRPAILWNDGRAASQRRWIEDRVGVARLLELAANRAMPGFTASSLLWVREHEPETFRRVRRLMLPKDYVRWRLYGGDPVTDASDASGTLLFDVRRRAWSAPLVDELELDPSLLPEVVESAQRVAVTADGTPVAAGAGDQTAAALGIGLRPDGPIGVALGTSGVLTSLSTKPPSEAITGHLQELASCGDRVWQTMGVTLAAGGSVAWWQQVSGEEQLPTLLNEASAWPVGSEGVTFLPYLSGERAPHLDEELRGSFSGLSAGHDRGALTRAVIEGVACSLADVLALLNEHDGRRHDRARVTGGLARSELVSGVVASALGLVLEHTEVEHGTSYGAALLAGITAGAFATLEEAAALPRVTRVTEPAAAEAGRYEQLRQRFRSLYREPDTHS